MSDMADVLVGHQRQNASSCLCGWSELGKSHPEHQAAMLAAAGFGPVREAQAQALEDAAKELDELWKWRRARFDRDWADGVEESEQLVRARAVTVRGEE